MQAAFSFGQEHGIMGLSMQYREYGKENTEAVILLHGGGLSWWNYREEAELLQNRYHVILPVLDGHAGSDRPFTSIEDNAAEIIAFIDEHFGGHVLFIGGLSLGAQVLLEMLAQRPDICTYALAESAAVIPQKITAALIAPAVYSSYGLIANRSFAKLQFEALHMKPAYFEDYYRDTCLIKREDMTAFMKASTSYSLKDGISGTSASLHVFTGTKETGVIRKSAEVIKNTVPSCIVRELPGLHHGEFSLNHAGEYAETVRKIISR